MAQTDGAISFVDAKIEYSTDGAAWNDISGEVNTVEISGGDRNSGEVFTADGDIPIITFGKLNPWDVSCTVVYTESATETFERLRGFHQADGGTSLQLRWAPIGSGTGNSQYTCGTSKLTEFEMPGGEVGGGEPLSVTFVQRTPSITKGTT